MSPQVYTDRFDKIWRSWGESTEVPTELARRRGGRIRFLTALKRHLLTAPRHRVLEVGCGSAIDLVLLSEDNEDLLAVGVDISAEALRVARKCSPSVGGYSGLCRADLFVLPFADGSFGMVFSQGVLEHFRDSRGCMCEQVRVLASGGTLVVNVPQRYTGYTLHKRRAIRRGTWPWGWETEYTTTELQAMGRSLGLICDEVFGYQYWRSWTEPAWILRDLYGKIHRRNPLAKWPPFPLLGQLYDRLWMKLEDRYGHLFLQNVVAVFRKPVP